MLTKVCTKCSVEKTVDCFSPQSAGKFGVRSVCKSCAAVVAMKHYEDNKESQLAKKKIYRRDHKDAIRSQVKQYQQINKEKLTTQKKHYQQTNPHIYAANNARRRSLKIQATPVWVDHETMSGIYYLATLFNRTGLALHVDHIVPLNSDTVCGLHCEANLQLLSASDNKSKGNRHWPDMW